MTDLRNKRCGHQGCNPQPSFGVAGGKKEFCAEHKRDGMVSLNSKSRTNGEVRASSEQGRGGGLASGDRVTGREAVPVGGLKRQQSSSPARSGGAKRARRVSGDVSVASTPVEPIKREGPASPNCSSESMPTNEAVKTEPAEFSIGRRGGWR